MLPIERLEIIKQIAKEEKRVYVSKLSKKFNVTDETIRRDLDKLEKSGILTRSYGGAIINNETICENKPSFTRLKINFEKEKYIAEKTANLIKEKSTIIADCSSIVLEALKLVKAKKDVTVMTNSIEALKELSKTNLKIISTGGIVNPREQSLQGSIMQEIIKNYNVDLAFIKCSGIDINKGIFDLNETEVEIKRGMIRQAKKVVLLAESTTFNKMSLVKLFDYNDIDYIVTEQKPKGEWMSLFNSHNIEVIY